MKSSRGLTESPISFGVTPLRAASASILALISSRPPYFSGPNNRMIVAVWPVSQEKIGTLLPEIARVEAICPSASG